MTGPDFCAYGPHHDGPDPLAPPLELREAVETLGAQVLTGASPRSALEELLRRGTPGMAGLDELTRTLWRHRARIQSRYRLDGTLRQVRRLLDEALEAERGVAHTDDSDEARFRVPRLSALSSGTAAAVSELADYTWLSEAGRDRYERIRELLGTQLLRSRFEAMKEAVRSAVPEEPERVGRALAELGTLLDAHADDLDGVDARFAEFLHRYDDLFPENPRSVDALIDLLAVRSSATRRMLEPMTDEQRAELAELSRRTFGDARIDERMSALSERLRRLRPGRDRYSSTGFRGTDSLGLGEGARAMTELSDLDELAEQLSQSYPGARLEDIDLELLERGLGTDAAVDARRLSELERQLRRQGLLERTADTGLRLSPKTWRRLGETALTEVTRSLGRGDTTSAGAAGEPPGSRRPWRFGDTEPWDVPRTVYNAVLRTASSRSSATVPLDATDVEVSETENRERTAVVLCVDTSRSMMTEGRWLPMKRTALALHHLISTRFREDALQLVSFGRSATTVEMGELAGMEASREPGTNAHHALLLAGRHLRRHPDAHPVVLMVTDGEPTAHLEQDGTAVFDDPPDPRTLAKTLSEVDELAKRGAALSVFGLGDDPRLEAFVDLLARRGAGRVVAPGLDGLGAAVVGDYLRHRHGR